MGTRSRVYSTSVCPRKHSLRHFTFIVTFTERRLNKNSRASTLPRGGNRSDGRRRASCSPFRDAAHSARRLYAGRSRRTNGNFPLAASKHSCAPAFALSPASDLPLSSASSTFVKLRALTTSPVERVVVTSGFLCRCKATICSSAVDRHAGRAPTPL